MPRLITPDITETGSNSSTTIHCFDENNGIHRRTNHALENCALDLQPTDKENLFAGYFIYHVHIDHNAPCFLPVPHPLKKIA